MTKLLKHPLMLGQSIFTASSGAVRHIHHLRLTFLVTIMPIRTTCKAQTRVHTASHFSHRTHDHDPCLLLEHPHESKRSDGRVTQYGSHFLVGFVGDREMETAKVTSEYWS